MKLIPKIKDKCIKLFGGHTKKEISDAYNSRIRIIDRTKSLTLEARAELYNEPFALPLPETFVKKELVSKLADEIFKAEGIVRYEKVRIENKIGLSCYVLTARINIIPMPEEGR